MKPPETETEKLLGKFNPNWSPLGGGAEEFPVSDVIDFEASSQDDVQFDLRSLFLGAIRASLEALLQEELRRLVGAGAWAQMGRRDYRNGSYLRGLVTSMGHLDVAVPRTRKSGSAAGVIGRYQRRTDEVDEAIVASYVNGVSTQILGTSCGLFARVSPPTRIGTTSTEITGDRGPPPFLGRSLGQLRSRASPDHRESALHPCPRRFVE